MEQAIENTIAMQVQRQTPAFQLVELPEDTTESENATHYDGGFRVVRSTALRSELLNSQ